MQPISGPLTLPLSPGGEERSHISGPPTYWDYFADRAFRGLAQASIWLILALLAFILWSIGGKASVAMRDHGLAFLTSATWDVGRQQFGILPHIWGTLYSSLLALAIGGVFGVTLAIFLTQDFLAPRLAQVFRVIVGVVAAIPGVVLRAVGALRRGSGDPSSGRLVQREARVDPVFQHDAERPGPGAGVARPRDHGAADRRRGFARCLSSHSVSREGGRIRDGGDSMGGHHAGHASGGVDRHLRRARARLRPRAR